MIKNLLDSSSGSKRNETASVEIRQTIKVYSSCELSLVHEMYFVFSNGLIET